MNPASAPNLALDLTGPLHQAAGRGQPLVVLVTLAGCAYCVIVRRNYLVPMQRAGGLVFAEVDMRGQRRVRLSAGHTQREIELARSWKITLAPTLLFLGPDGNEYAPRVVGFSEHFFGAQLDGSLEAARQRLARGRS